MILRLHSVSTIVLVIALGYVVEAFFVGHPTRRRTLLFAPARYTTSLGSSEEENLELVKLRNLRFSGVGRLYSPPNNATISDEQRHLDVVDRLSKATVMVVGLGGVGSWAAEAICRSGVGKLVLIDLDDICISNTNRQLHAMTSTIGKMKIDEMKKRLNDINPECEIQLIHDFVSPRNIDSIFHDFPNVTTCLDAIDGSIGKASLIAACARYGIPVVTCGGSAGRTDPTKFICEDLTRADGDALLSTCRKTLRKRYGFEKNEERKKSVRKWNIRAVYSTERQKLLPEGSDASSLRRCDGALGTACFVTGTCGFVAASEVIAQIANDNLLPPGRFRRGLCQESLYDDSIEGSTLPDWN